MLQILNKEDFEQLCDKEGFKPFRVLPRSQESPAPEIRRVESAQLNPLDLLYTREKWLRRGLI